MDFKGLLDDEVLAGIDRDAGLQQALALIAASGPSASPSNLGQILLQGGQVGQQARQQGLESAMQRQKLLDAQKQKAQRQQILGGLTGGVQQALVGGGGPTVANAEKMQGGMSKDRYMQAFNAAISIGDVELAKQIKEAMEVQFPKQESLFDKVDVSKFTPDSVRMFSQSGNYADLVAKPDEPEAIKTLRILQQNPDLYNAQVNLKRAGAANTNVNIGGDNAFAKKGAELTATAFNDMAVQGRQANRTLAQISQLESLSAKTGGGIVPAAKAFAGNLGINVEGLDDVQAFSALINQLVPQQRPPGSGTMSDADLALFKQSLPRLINQPGGNQKIISTMRAIAEYDRKIGQIAADALNNKITRAEADMLMQRVPNPLAEFSAGGGGGEGSGRSEQDLLNKYGIK